jgi:hypothetical protein
MKYNVERCPLATPCCSPPGEYLPARAARASHLISLTPNTTAIHLGQTYRFTNYFLSSVIIQYPRNYVKNNCN